MKNTLKTLLLASAFALAAGAAYADSGSKTTPCYIIGKTINVDSGCTLHVLSGGALTLDSGSTETNSATNTSSGNATWSDGKNIVIGTTTGSKIGTATTQKLGFYNATPIVQVGATTDVVTGLQNLGLFASGTHPGTFGALTYTTLNGNTWATGTGTLSIAAGKTFTASNTLTLAGTDSTTMTFPGTSDTVVTLAATQTLTNKTLTDFIDNGSVVSSAISATSGTTGTTLTNIPGLSVALTAGKTYAFRAYVTGTSTTNSGVKLAFANSGSTTSSSYTCSQHNNATNNAETTTTTMGNAVAAATTVFTNAWCEGVVVVNAAGNLTMQFAQNASHADTTTVNANGYLTVRRLN